LNLTDLTGRMAEWLKGAGPLSGLVVSSRVRLARNLAGMPFLTRCSEAQRRKIAEDCEAVLSKTPLPGEMLYVDIERAEELDRQLLVERRLISRQLAEAEGPRGVAVAGGETVAVMVNEEDHLRVQVLRGGLQLDSCYAEIRRIDEQLEQRLTFAFSPRFGYLTACPTNVGTALRVSVMLHLPALKMTGQIERALRAARDMHLAVRGLYGEGTEAVGDLFQVSNQVTLGKSEEQLVEDFKTRVVPGLIEYERRARESVLKDRRTALEDKVYRALAVLRSARLIGSEEAMYLLSHVRLGLALEIVDNVELATVNELSLAIQPAHLRKTHNHPDMPPHDRGQVRADLIRQRLAEKGQ
jgi:protein arginine kinase